MKHYYSKIRVLPKILILLSFLLPCLKSGAQTTLAAGDIIFTSYDSSPSPGVGDGFSFVLLAPISSNTQISFTDRGYFTNLGGWQAAGSSESTITWTSSTALPMGTEVHILGLGAQRYNPSNNTSAYAGTVTLTEGTTTNGLSLSNVGDCIIAFQGGGGSPSGSGVTIIAGLNYFYSATTTTAGWNPNPGPNPNASAMPPGLIGGISAFYTGPATGLVSPPAGKFSCAGMPGANAAAIRTAVMNPANWTLSTAASLGQYSGCTFLAVSQPAVVTAHPPNRTICSTGSTTFTVTASNATGYQWQVNDGGGFVPLTNTAPYSGVSTATLTITGATAGMNGFIYRVLVTGSGGNATSNQGTLTVSSISTATWSQTNVSCNGANNGIASVTPSGGITPYFYSWAPSGGTAATATGLTAGTYTVTISDNIGCTATRTYTITEPPALSATATVTDTSTNTGAIDMTVSGGQPGYTYLWNDGVTTQDRTGLTAGTYSVTITDANNCQKTESFTVNSACSVVASITSQINILCPGTSTGEATVGGTGGTAPYTYLWSNGATSATATGLAAGTYTVTVTDATTCSDTETVTITSPSIPVTIYTQDFEGAFPGNMTTAAINGTSHTWFQSGSASGNNDAGGTGFYARADSDYTCNSPWDTVLTTPVLDFTGLAGVTLTFNNYFQDFVGAGEAWVDVSTNGGTSWTTEFYETNDQSAALLTVDLSDYDGMSNVLIRWRYSDNGDGCAWYWYIDDIVIKTTGPAALSLAATSVNNVPCNGGSNGSATVTVSNGVAPFSYSWSNGISLLNSPSTTNSQSGLTAGTYTVVVSDANGCSANTTVTITEPAAALSASQGTVNNVSCNSGSNGTATVIASGGTPGYTYSWAPSGGTSATASGLTAGTYTVTVTDANNCQVTKSFTLTEPSVLSVSAGTTNNVSCNGGNNGSATVDVSGGTGPYTYSWAPMGGTAATASGLLPGTYTVTVTDANNCQATQSFTITQPSSSVNIDPVMQTNIACNGAATGAATVSAATGGTGGYTYDWTPGNPTGDGTTSVSGLTAGTWTCTVTDANGCTDSQSFTIIQYPALSLTPASQTNIACNGGATGAASVNPAMGGQPGYTYNWSPGNPTGDGTTSISGVPAGTWTCTVTDAFGCTANVSFTITQPPVLNVTASVTDTSTNTGAIDLSISGGTPGYTYSWNTGATSQDISGLLPGTYTVTVTDANACSKVESFTINSLCSVVASITSHTNVSCTGGSNGSAMASATGGVGTVSYSWAPTGGTNAVATGLAAGTYTVTVTDANNCTDTETITITEPASPVNATADTQTNVSCNGGANGSATVAVTGGTGAYTYSWAPSGGTAATANGLAQGTYTVTVSDANGCIDTQSFTITEPTILSVTPSQTNVSCNGGTNGSATATVTGGTGAYTYLWAPSGGTAATASGLAQGTYTVTVTDANNCQITQSFTITQPTVLNATAGAQTNVSCFGGTNGSATVAVTGGTGTYTYSWAPSGGTAATASGLTQGTYTVTVTDANGCTDTQSFTITQPTVLNATAGSQTNVSCFGGNNGSATVAVTGGTGTYTYSWAPSGGTAATASGLAQGTYTVTVTDANGCTDTQSFTITQPTLLNATAGSQTNVSCFGGNNGSATVAVTGGTGTYTYSWAPSGGTAATASGLTQGTYTVTVTDANGCTDTQSFTITQPTVLDATAGSQTNVSCFGGTNGSATVAVTGGTGTYTYSWAPSGGTAATASGLAQGTYTVTVTDANGCTDTQSFTITQPSLLDATAGSQTNVSCNGGTNGSATVAVTGGTGAYTYSWAPSGGTAATASGLTQGTYTVTVTDANGCTDTQSFTITQPTVLNATAGSQTNVSCFGGTNGSATVAVTGGTGAYTYSWAPSGGTAATATGLTQGTYTVTVTDANNCQATQSYTITQPTVLDATAGAQTNVSCNGGTNGSATVAVTGGTGTYTYSWAPSGGTAATASGLTQGTYTVTVTDANGCTDTQSFTITQPSLLDATAGSQTNVSCFGGTNGSATVAVTGGTGTYTYSWAPSGGTAATASGLAQGTYTVTVTDANGCTDTQSFTITQPTVLNATAGSQTNVSCFGGTNGSATVAVTGGTGAYTYSWAPSGGTAATASGLAQGTYTVTVTDANGCTDTQSFTITQPTVLDATAGSQTNVSCFGGTNGSATVAVTGGTGTYTYSWAPSGGTAATASGLTQGTYTVTVTDANGCTDTQSFTITQPTVLNATAGSQTNVSCFGGNNGSATVAVTGGTGTYTYSWAPSGGTAATASGLAQGTYTVTVTDANGCTDTQSFTITQPTLLNATAGAQTNVSCFGGTNGSATVAVTGGTGTYTYSWAPSGGTAATASGLTQGTYTVTVTDANGCTDTQSFTITQPTVLDATAGSQTNVSCFGGTNGSATVAVTGGTGAYTYSWAPSGGTAATASGLVQGTYTVTVTDANGCTDTQSFTITEPATLTASAAQDFPATCAENADGGATVTVAGGTLPYTYAWDNAETTASATALTVGSHTITVTDANGCTATATVTISFSDTTAPVPTVANLPDIIAECVVTEADVPVPTATDECAGTIVVTHNATFPITGQGTTVITWTYEDVNGNTTTQTQNVVIDDISAPVPTITNLPVIAMQCQVLTTDIPVPTATDNCAGALVATTTDPLLYTALGTYTITWSYDDGNNNITTQTQTVVVTESAINAVTFTNETVVYNTAPQAITVDNLPAGATVAYTITPDTGLGNAAINAGTYTVTAVVTPAPNAPNCDPITLSATLTIEQAPQVITFNPIPVKNLEADPDFQLTATANSGLPVYYTYTFTAPTTPATVTSGGWVDMLTSGIVQITAHQDGNANYLPATPVTQELVINSSDASIHTITIGDTEYTNPGQDIYHLMLCEDTASSVTVNLVTEVNATAVPGHTFVIETPQPGIYSQTVTITSQDGTVTQTFTVTVEKMFQFFDIAVQKFDNVLLANNNPSTNGGYSFTAYEWYKNGVLVGRNQYFSEGPTNDDLLDPNAEYYLKLTTVEGDVLQTCIGQVTLEHSFRISVFPNPAVTGSDITVTADFPGEEFNDMRIDIHDINGRLVHSGRTNQRVTQIQLGTGIEAGVYIVSCTTDKHRESFKIIVRK